MSNDNILELAKQILVDPAVRTGNHIRFAELLVRDCIFKFESSSGGQSSYGDYDYGGLGEY